MGAALGVMCLLWALVVAVFGLVPLVFTSDSMSPQISAGDLAFAKSVPARDLAVGDVVSVENSRGVRITHRIVTIEDAEQGAALTLQGDANENPDDETYLVASADRVLFSVPKAGYVVSAVSSPWGMFAGGIIVAVVLVMAFRPRVHEP